MSQGKARAILFDCAAICSLLTQAALFGIIITLTLVDISIARLKGYILVASTLDGILVLAFLVIVVKIFIEPEISIFEVLLAILCSTLSLCALTLSLYIFVNVWTISRFTILDLKQSATACLAVTGIVLCSITILAQTTTYIMLLIPARHAQTSTRGTSSSSTNRFSMACKACSSTRSPSRTRLTLYSPSLTSSRSLKLSRPNSFGQVWSALGSKTRLASFSAQPHDSVTQLSRREPSLEITCRGDVTELVSAEPYELSSSPPPRLHHSRGRLETIPGSRPVSPAKPLQSFLFDEIKPEDFPLPDSPTMSRGNSPVYLSNTHDGLPFPPMIGEIATSSQTHIHPLFRTDSPGPHPERTPGTKVVASPFAGQVVGPNHVLARNLRSAHSSRPSTPAKSPVPSLERYEMVPNFSRPGALSRNESRKAEMF